MDRSSKSVFVKLVDLLSDTAAEIQQHGLVFYKKSLTRFLNLLAEHASKFLLRTAVAAVISLCLRTAHQAANPLPMATVLTRASIKTSCAPDEPKKYY